jgi:hypothetical protein
LNISVDDKKSSFSISGIMDVQFENFINPVTGKEHDTRIQVTKGLIKKVAEVPKSKIMRIASKSKD